MHPHSMRCRFKVENDFWHLSELSACCVGNERMSSDAVCGLNVTEFHCRVVSSDPTIH